MASGGAPAIPRPTAVGASSDEARDQVLALERTFGKLVSLPSEEPRTPTDEEITMAKVSPYHSSNPTDPDVYHDHDDCRSGQQIPAHNKRSGTGRYPRCQHCVEMG